MRRRAADDPDSQAAASRRAVGVAAPPPSSDAAWMLEASRKHGKFWPALEAVLANRSRWVSNHVARNLEQDRSDAKALGVTMTPECFVNGRPLPDFGLAQLQVMVRDAVQSTYR